MAPVSVLSISSIVTDWDYYSYLVYGKGNQPVVLGSGDVVAYLNRSVDGGAVQSGISGSLSLKSLLIVG